MAVQTVPPPLSLRRHWLLRGESAVASVGISVAAILLAAMAALAVWTTRCEQVQLDASQTLRLREVGSLMALTIESMLARDELSAARRLVADSARGDSFTTCRILLAQNEILADAEPSRINVHSMTSWPSGPLNPLVDSAEELGASFPIHVPGRGEAMLQLGASRARGSGIGWEAQTGIGIIGAVSLLAMLLAYRRMRGKMQAIGAIREALLASAAGELATAALMVNPNLGPEAAPWNAILTERESHQKQMRSEQAKQAMGSRQTGRHDLDAAFDALPQGLILVDENLRVRYSNGAAAVFLQCTGEAINGAAIDKIIAQEEVLANLQAISTGAVRRKASIEVEQKTAAATTVLRFSIRPVRRDDFAAAMIIIEDITQQRMAAESRNNFVAQATHELRTPLTNIRLYVETAIDDGAKDAVLRGNCLNVINQEARRLERIVGEMLSVAEIEAGSLKIRRNDVRFDQLMNDLKADFQQQAQEKKLKLEFHLPPKMPVIQADRDKIMVALHNLIGNALKYTPEGGEVTVQMDVEPNQIVVGVADTGIGISEEDAARIFDRFYRASDPRVEKITGTGLGLTLAREVVRLHGGDITVRSELNKGSTFTLNLPASTEAA